MRRWGLVASTVTDRHTANISFQARLAVESLGATSSRFSGDDQALQSSFNHRDLFVDLADRQAEVVTRSCAGPKLERQLLPLFPDILKRATVLMPDVHLNDLLHRF
jgi:hypothetical protein